MSAPFAPTLDTTAARADLAELVHLSARYGFDLYGLARLISETGRPIFCREVDDVAAEPAGRGVVRQKLCQELQVMLTALRARDGHTDEIQRCSGCWCSFAVVGHGQVASDSEVVARHETITELREEARSGPILPHMVALIEKAAVRAQRAGHSAPQAPIPDPLDDGAASQAPASPSPGAA